MWFKRRKKSDQDHALSQSLRSLQSLLNETDRREPTLDAGTPDPETDAPDEFRAAEQPLLDEDQAAVLREPAPPDSASRWRDLSLSFDAEPILPPRTDPEDVPEDVPEDEAVDDEATQGIHEAASDLAGESAATEHQPVAVEPDEEPGPDEPELVAPPLGDGEAGPAEADDPESPGEPVEATVSADTHDDPSLLAADAEQAGQTDVMDEGEQFAPPTEPRLDTAAVDIESFSDTSDTLYLEEPALPAYRVSETEEGSESEPETPEPGQDTADIETGTREPGAETADTGTRTETILPEPAGLEAPDFPASTGMPDTEAEATSAKAPEAVVDWEEPVAPGTEAETEQEARAPAPRSGSDERTESQLRLELEPAEESEDDIPTLTEAVYVPDAPPEPPSEVDASQGALPPETTHGETPPPEEDTSGQESPAAEQPREEEDPPDRIEWCVNQLRTRLHALDVEPLSPEQEAQLRDTLSVLLYDLPDDESGY